MVFWLSADATQQVNTPKQPSVIFQLLGIISQILFVVNLLRIYSIKSFTVPSFHTMRHHFCHFLLSLQHLLLEPNQSSFMHPWSCTLADPVILSLAFSRMGVTNSFLVLISYTAFYCVATHPLQSCPSFGAYCFLTTQWENKYRKHMSKIPREMKF